MIRSMYSGISGMKNQQVKMDTIGNNIANLGTVAFKGSRVTFKDALTQTTQAASAPTFSIGGTNPRQVGLGMAVSSVDRNMTNGTNAPTGRATDFGIEGSGYFRVQNGAEIFYTRDGSFTMDRFGDLVTSSGLRVMGIDKSGNRGPINIPLEHDTVPAIKFGITTKKEDGKEESIKEVLSVKLTGYDGGDYIKDILIDGKTEGGKSPISMKDGKITISIGGYENLTELEKAISNQLKEIGEMTKEEIEKHADKDNIQAIKDNILDRGIDRISVTGDLAAAKDEKNVPTIMDESRPSKVGADGKTTYAKEGFKIEKVQLGSFSVGKDGKIRCTYGEDTFDVARLELARFVNDAGLEAMGGNLYRETANSGQATLGYPNSTGFGSTEQGFLEMSNVDLANEFTDMIVTSRSYQANSRTITTSDEMLQELLNLKR